jgi:NAD(P)-dependent dehydrogenase (short-subunit alcohol dehydrogenase family)
VLVARGEAELQGTAARIRTQGGEAHALAADVGDKRAPHRIAGAAAALVGPIELLVHNASTLGPTPLRLLLDTECEDLERGAAVNLVGPFRLTKIVAGAMALRGSGLVVHVSSDAAVAAYPRWGAYGVSKAALDHLNRHLGRGAGGTGVRFFSVDPGEMDTEMHAAAMPDADRASLARPADVARRDRADDRPNRSRAARGSSSREKPMIPARWPREEPLRERLLHVDPSGGAARRAMSEICRRSCARRRTGRQRRGHAPRFPAR